jgi:tetratricopeptide (TPR) repeat protein
MANLGPHSKGEVNPADASRVLDDLCEVIEWYMKRYENKELISTGKDIRESEKSKPVIPSISTESTIKKKLIKKLILIGSVTVLLIIGYFLIKPIWEDALLISNPIPIAVITFENQTGDSSFNYLRKAIPNLLITNLEQSKYLRVTTFERLNDLLKQAGKKQTEMIDKETGFELCRMDGIDAIVIGSYIKAGDMFVTDIKVLDVQTKKILKSANAKGKGAESILENQIDKLSKEIAEGVGLAQRKIEETKLKIVDVTTNSIDAYENYIKGKEYFDKCYWDEARKYFEAAVHLDSTFATAYLFLAHSYGNLGNWDTDRKNIQKAVEYSYRASEKEQARIRLFTGKISKEEGVKMLETLVQRYPKEKEFHQRLGWLYRGIGRFDEAVVEFKKALELDPNWSFALNLLGATYIASGNLEKALETFKRYESIYPDDATACISIGDIYLFMGLIEQAINKYRDALRLKPDNTQSMIGISYAYALREKYDDALHYAEQCVSISSTSKDSVDGYIIQASLQFWLGNLENSLISLQKAADISKQLTTLHAEVSFLKGWIWNERKNYRRAKENFTEALEVYNKRPTVPKLISLLCNEYLGFIDLKDGPIEQAKSRLNDIKYLLLNGPIQDEYWMEYGKLEYNQLYSEILCAEDSLDKAAIFYESTSILPLQSMLAYYLRRYNIPYKKDFLATIYTKKGEIDKAITEYEKLITFNQEVKDRHLIHPKYHYRLGLLYEQKGMNYKAIEQYKKFLEIWKYADKDLPEPKDAKKRLNKLLGMTKH